MDELVQQTIQFTFEGVGRYAGDHLIDYSASSDSGFNVPEAVDA